MDNVLESIYEYIGLWFDWDVVQWQIWLLWPLITLFIIPISIIIFICGSALFVEFYRHWHGLVAAYEHSVWDGARYLLAVCWRLHGRIWHGYQVCGLENIPRSGPVIILFYHGALPVDFYYLLSELIISSIRPPSKIKTVGDRFLYKIPGWTQLMKVMCILTGGMSECCEALREDSIVAIAPGGVREALLASDYTLMWRSRVGFARLAIQTNATIVPMFTRNICEAYRSLASDSTAWHWLYESTRLPLVPVYGGFPVKLCTFLGLPISPSVTADCVQDPHLLALQAAHSINSLIRAHQPFPASIVRALFERFALSLNN